MVYIDCWTLYEFLSSSPCSCSILIIAIVVVSSSPGGGPSLSLDDAADTALETSTALGLVHHGHRSLCSALHLGDEHDVQRYKSITKDPIHVPTTTANAKHPNV